MAEKDLFGPVEPDPEREWNGLALRIAKMLFAMEKRDSKKPDLREAFRNERYRRTMSDEYPFSKPSRAGYAEVSEEQKSEWRKLALK